jgi:hypothetical protein
MQRTIPECRTTLYTLGTSNTEYLIDNVFEVGFFDKFSLNGCSGTKLVFRSGMKFGPGFEISPAQVTISTQVIGMDAFNR